MLKVVLVLVFLVATRAERDPSAVSLPANQATYNPRLGTIQSHESGINALSGWDPLIADFRSPLFNWSYDRGYTSNVVLQAPLPDQLIEIIRSTDRFQTSSELMKETKDIKTLNSLSVSASGKYKSITGSASYTRRQTAEQFQVSSRELVRTSSFFTTHELTLAYDRFPLMTGFREPILRMCRLLALSNASFVGVNQDNGQTLPLEQLSTADQSSAKNLDSESNHILETINYQLDQLLLIFGPEYIWRAVYGGSLTIDLVVDRSLSKNTSDDDIKTSASLGFVSYFKVKMDRENRHQTNNTLEKMTRSRTISVQGGLPWNDQTTQEEWQRFVPLAPAIIGYETRETVDLINHLNFPELDSDLLYQLRQLMIKRVMRYYQMNTITGCLDRRSVNYCWYCNSDDHFCQKQDDHLLLGGFYQTGSYPKVNALTQQNSCPTNYTSHLLMDGSFTSYSNYQERICHHHFFGLKKKCHSETRTTSQSHPQQTYLCTSPQGTPDGFYFGGAYSDQGNVKNENTDDQVCPPTFHDQIIFYYAMNQGVHMCLKSADEVDQVPIGSQKFGGIFNCQQKNPFTQAFSCAPGFMKYPLGSHQNCDWFYCVGRQEMKHGFIYYPPGYGVKNPDFPEEVIDSALALNLTISRLVQPAVAFEATYNPEIPIAPSGEIDHPVALNLTIGLMISVILVLLTAVICLACLLRKSNQRPIKEYPVALKGDSNSQSYHNI